MRVKSNLLKGILVIAAMAVLLMVPGQQASAEEKIKIIDKPNSSQKVGTEMIQKDMLFENVVINEIDINNDIVETLTIKNCIIDWNVTIVSNNLRTIQVENCTINAMGVTASGSNLTSVNIENCTGSSFGRGVFSFIDESCQLNSLVVKGCSGYSVGAKMKTGYEQLKIENSSFNVLDFYGVTGVDLSGVTSEKYRGFGDGTFYVPSRHVRISNTLPSNPEAGVIYIPDMSRCWWISHDKGTWADTDIYISEDAQEFTYKYQMLSNYEDVLNGTATGDQFYSPYNDNIDVTLIVAPEKTPVGQFVMRMYNTALSREAEAAGLQDWVDRLIEQEVTGATFAYGVVFSEEFQNRGLNDSDYLDVLYKSFFDRDPDPEGKANWMQLLGNGMSRENVLAGFTNSVEFQTLCDQYGITRGELEMKTSKAALRAYVERLYNKALSREGEEQGINDWVNAIEAGTVTAEDAAKKFFASEEFQNRNLDNAAYVETLYNTFLDRDSDPSGRADWVGRLEKGEYSREQILEGFSQSEEFKRIVASFGL